MLLIVGCSKFFGITRRVALTITIVMSVTVMLLPVAVRSIGIRGWIFAVFVVLLAEIIVVWRRPTEGTGEVREPCVEEVIEIAESTQAVIPEEMGITAKKVDEETFVQKNRDSLSSTSLHEADSFDHLSIDECLDRGFAAKCSGNFAGAAEWFVKALQLHPDQDIAFYLMTDAYKLWNASGQGEAAVKRLTLFWQIYINEFSPYFYRQFVTWLNTENLYYVISQNNKEEIVS